MTDGPLRLQGKAFQPPASLRAERVPDPCSLVIFGATGDLTRRKLLPALYNLSVSKALPEAFSIIGVSRGIGEPKDLVALWREHADKHSRQKPIQEQPWETLVDSTAAVPGDFSDAEVFVNLRKQLEANDRELGTRGNRMFYFATPPSTFPMLLQQLREHGLIYPVDSIDVGGAKSDSEPWSRVVLEKPFGTDLKSAQELNRQALSVLDESQIYRIDHYLGKETVQNILVFRFGNMVFEPLWNRNHIDHVEITMAESIGVEGRGRFYEQVGVMRDIVQNHLLQVMALCAMESPVSFEANEVRNMKAQLLRSLRPFRGDDFERCIVRGQYEGYRDEEGVADDSRTPTFVAIKTFVDNWRWQGVPFYLRAGKGLKARETEVSFHFKQIPFCLFGDESVCQLVDHNVLTLRIQPDEGIKMRVVSKVPGEGMRVGSVDLDFLYRDAFTGSSPDAYERLLLDCMRGDATLFARKDEVELSWGWVTPILEAWAEQESACPSYPLGSSGPEDAARLIAKDGKRWTELGE